MSRLGRIAILTSEFAPFRGGVATYVHEMAAAAAGLGWEVTVHAPSYGRRYDAAETQALPYALRRFGAGLTSPLRLPAYARAAYRVLKDGPDLIHAADLCALEGLALLVWRRPGPIIATLHGTDVNLAARTRRGRVMAQIRPFDCASRLVANSEFTRRLALSRLPRLDPERLGTAPLGVAERFFDPAPWDCTPIALRDPTRFRVLCVGRITPRKGQDVLLEAIARLPSALRQRVSVLIAGRASEGDRGFAEQLRGLAAAARPAEVAFHEGLDDTALRAAFGAADVFCLPGRDGGLMVEGFGLVFLEAAAQGTAAIAGHVGGVAEAVEHGVGGLITPAEDVGAMAEAIAKLAAQPALLARMGAAARHRARAFTWERCARLTYG
ncbi:MAG: glycosyltransferase family 4 protein [Pikeienuella sp.]